jgi:hypothetical protein
MPTIPIRREAGCRTDTIGRHAGEQFYAAGCSLPSNRPGADLHDDTDRRGIPSTSSDLLATLHGVEFDDIAIQLFRLDYDGYAFGLIDESDPERGP